MATQETGWQRGFSPPPEQTVMVALDLETTGVDPRNDRILEIGAVKFRGSEEIDRFSSLVDPGTEIPPFITELTGIRKQDLAGAPRIEAVIPDLSEWLADHPMIGHNVGFDAAFLRRNGVPSRLETFDTYDLAYALLPGASEYGLGGLGKQFGLLHDSPHRALSDALATRDLFILLLKRLRELDPALLAEFSRLTAASGWSTGILAGRVMDTMSPEEMRSALGPGAVDLEDLSKRLRHRPRPRVEAPGAPGLEADGLEGLVASVFRDGGHLARNLPEYEHRDEQERMARSVAKALEQGEHLVVEAGTGVGKSLAYLVPSALWAISNDSTILVSTNTINLQEQLLGKDIPAVKAVLGALDLQDDSLVSTQLKGRANYLCMRRWLHARAGAEMSVEEARLLAKTYVWLQDTETGDRNELRLSRDDQSQFTRMSAQGANGCPPQDGPCFLRTARLRANNAHIVIINHSLLMSDLVMGGGLLPEHDALIIDEAHHLEGAATRNLGFSIEQRQVEGELASMSGDRGLAADALATLRSRAPLLAASGNLDALENRLGHTVSGARETASGMFRTLADSVRDLTPRRGPQGRDLRITGETRLASAWQQVKLAWENFDNAASRLSLVLRELSSAAERAAREAGEDTQLEAVRLNVEAAMESLDSVRSGLRQAMGEPDPDMVYWLTTYTPDGNIAISGAPLEVGPSLQEQLFERERCVVLTSGTLSHEGTFERAREKLGVRTGADLLLGSPFDFRRAALVLLVEDLPEPGKPGFNEGVGQALQDVARNLRDRVLALFTSNSSLSSARSSVAGPLRSEGINVVAQGVDGPPHRVMQALDADPCTVALGTNSLWEGVDLQESSIKALMMARLPFPVPSDPVFAARSEMYDNGFDEYAVPEAVLRFRQGFGRLIRSSTDRGVFVVLDSRVVTRGYGASFSAALPECRVERVSVSEVGQRALRWHEKGE